MAGSYFTREFIVFVILVFVLSSVMTVVGISEGYNANAETVNRTVSEISRLRETVSAFDIFFNNVFIVFMSAVPIVGLLFFVFVSFNTGFAYGNIGKYYGLSFSQACSIYFTNEIAILEEIAYILLVAESLYIVYLLIIKRESVKERVKEHSWKSLLISCSLLLFGAFLEYFLIKG